VSARLPGDGRRAHRGAVHAGRRHRCRERAASSSRRTDT
jgi:hypothetical protein